MGIIPDTISLFPSSGSHLYTQVYKIFVIPAGIAGQIGTIADLHLPEGQCTRIYIVNPGFMDGLGLPSMALDTRFPAGMTSYLNICV